MALSAGDRVGRYEIVAKIGEGGMGVVYRARDASLGRNLAIKILPPELTRDASRVERFMQEARAASALNHPHLTAIYEIGTEPVHYIAMELVDGRNLRDLLGSGRLELKRTLDYLLQICDALGAAHQAGVVHRDIKPENLMIADNGYAKILDFGVAKLKSDAHAGAEEATRASLTDAGVMVGTSGYMSPEQARGQTIDHRTDIFALGCVLYECLTGARAFDAPSAIERMNRVIKDDPAPIAERAPGVPSDLIRIVRKCLAKDAEDRYQSMKDLAIDLRDVRRQLDTGTAAASATSPAPVVARARGPIVWAIVALTVAAGIGLLYVRRPAPAATSDSDAAASSAVMVRLTTTGNTIDSGISPDARFLVHTEAVGSQQSLWVRTIATGEERQLVPVGPYAFYGARVSPDGREVFYTTRGVGHGSGRLNVIPIDGGAPRVLLAGIVTPVTFSPDATRVAFYREQYPNLESSALVVAGIDGANERILATRRTPEAFSPGFFVGPSWSPDGRLIAASLRDRRAATAKLIVIDAASGQERELMSSRDDICYTQWLHDGTGIVYVMRTFVGFGGGSGQIWMKPFPDGAPRRVTADLIDYRQVSISADGKTMTAVGQDLQAQFYVMPLDGSPLRRIRTERNDGFFGVAELRDGSFIASSMVNATPQIIRISADGTKRRPLTSVRINSMPAVSPDESTIAMVSIENGKFGIWAMNLDGTNQRLLSEVAAPGWLSFTPDGRYVICTSYESAVPSTLRVPVQGGQAVEIARQFDRAAVSPDGKWLAGVYNASVNNEVMSPMMSVVAMDGSSPVRSLGRMPTASGTGVLVWAKDGSGVIASSNERFNLFFFPLNGGEPKRLTNLQDDTIFRGALSPDGTHVIASRGQILRDTFVIKELR